LHKVHRKQLLVKALSVLGRLGQDDLHFDPPVDAPCDLDSFRGRP